MSFTRYGRLYYFDPGKLRPAVGDKLLVPTEDGAEVAECVWASPWVAEDTAGFRASQGSPARGLTAAERPVGG